MTTPGAGEGERWEVGPESPFGWGWPVTRKGVGTFGCSTLGDAQTACDYLNKLHNAREADQQTIADLKVNNRVLGAMVAKAMKELRTQDTTIAELRKALEVARKECKSAVNELDDLREYRCTCPHDYFHGDRHYMYCPAADEMKAATKRIWSGLNRPAYYIDKALAAIAATEEGKS